MHHRAPLALSWPAALLGIAAVAALGAAPAAFAAPLSCTSTPPGAPAVTIEVVEIVESGTLGECFASVRGSVDASAAGGWDVYIIVDSSGSTAGSSGIDLDGDGIVGQGDWRNPTDPGDSTLRAELEAVRRALDAWEGRDVRVALIEYSAVIPIPPGEPNEQGRIRTVQGLTPSFAAVRSGLDTVAAAGSVGATDYGGALRELAAEFDRSGDPSRWPVAFFLSDGKPTFSRFPYDTTEPTDVAEAMAGAQLLADRGLPVHCLEIGIFDDIGVLQDISNLTGGRLLGQLTGAGILDSIASIGLDPVASLDVINVTASLNGQTARDAAGGFTATVPLQGGLNVLTIEVRVETSTGSWLITCPLEVSATCPRGSGDAPGRDRPGSGRPGGDTGGGGADDGRTPSEPPARRSADRGGSGGGVGGSGGGGTGGGGGWDSSGRGGSGGAGGDRGTGRRWRGWPNDTARRVWERWGVTECIGLEGGAPRATNCAEALRQLIAIYRSIEVGELRADCPLDPADIPGYATVGDLVRELETAIDRNGNNRCGNAATLAARLTAGTAFPDPVTGPTPTGSTTLDCTTVQSSPDFDVRVTLESPSPGDTLGTGSPCPARVRVTGDANARGRSTHDVYFVVDTSGSTAGSSGRDVNGDTVPDSTLEAELEALRASVAMLDPAITRVALIEFSAVIPIPPGEPNEQGRIRTVQSLTSNFSQFYAGLDAIRSAGSVGATDYGGALLELAAEFDRNGDPARGHVAFFLSDGKPTFPRFPYDSTEPLDVDHAMQGASACASRGIVVNTFEVGVFDDLSTLQAVADRTGGRHVGELAGGAIVDALPGSTLVGIQSVRVRNDVTGVEVTATLRPDGSWDAFVNLVPGGNRIVITTTSDQGAEVVECVMELVSDCTQSGSDCAVRTPELWQETDCP